MRTTKMKRWNDKVKNPNTKKMSVFFQQNESPLNWDDY